MSEDPDFAAQESSAMAVHLPLARGIARALWQPEFKAANPDADSNAVNAAWLEVRQQHVRPVLRALRIMRQRGYVFTAPGASDES